MREDNNFLLRQLAAKMDIDTAQLSKMERGERLFKKDEIIEIAEILNANTTKLLSLWLADKIYKIIEGEEQVFEALKIVEQKLSKQ